jgi:hypothetical protein
LGIEINEKNLFPASSPNASAKFQQMVDLPTPPLLLNIEMSFAIPLLQALTGIIVSHPVPSNAL